MKIHLATDHAGLDLKNAIKAYLIQNSHDITDHGAHEYDAQDDYPDFISGYFGNTHAYSHAI